MYVCKKSTFLLILHYHLYVEGNARCFKKHKNTGLVSNSPSNSKNHSFMEISSAERPSVSQPPLEG